MVRNFVGKQFCKVGNFVGGRLLLWRFGRAGDFVVRLFSKVGAFSVGNFELSDF